MAKVAANFAGQLVRDALCAWIVPLEVMMPMCEIDVIFVEDCCPLEWCSFEVETHQLLISESKCKVGEAHASDLPC